MQMAKMHVKLILAGREKFADVPTNYQAAVKTLLEEKAAGGDRTAQDILKAIGQN